MIGLFIPRIGYTTGDIGIHDLAVEEEANASFSSAAF